MPKNKLIYCVAEKGDNGGIFSLASDWLKMSADAYGVEVVKLNLSRTEDLLSLSSYLLDKDNAIFSNIWLYDFHISGFGLAEFQEDFSSGKSSFSHVTALIADHPFTTYMYSRIRKSTSAFRYLFLDESYSDAVTHIRGEPLRSEKLSGVFTPDYASDDLPNYQDRVIDLLAPMAIYYPNVSRHWEHLSDPHLKRLFYYVWNTYSYRLEKTVYQYFIECSKQILQFEINLCANDESFRLLLIHFLSELDLLTRARFREDTITFIAKKFPNLTIHITDSPNKTLSEFENLRFIGRVSFGKCVQLIANSKKVLHCQPTYFDSFHERPIVTQSLGSLVVTPAGRWTQNLLPNSFVAFSPYGDCELLHDVLDVDIWPTSVDRTSPDVVSRAYGSTKFLEQLLYVR
jgi:hypothetical protein